MGRKLLVFIPCFTLILLVLVNSALGDEKLSKSGKSKKLAQNQKQIDVKNPAKFNKNIESSSSAKMPKKIYSNNREKKRRTGRMQKSLADLAANDPFSGGAAGGPNKTANGQQLTCVAAGIPCTSNCSFLDWWVENNRTIAVTPYRELPGSFPAECLAACQAAAPNCTAFSFNPTTRNCSIFSTFLYSKMVPGTGFSLYVRLGPLPPPTILNEWILTRDRRPYYDGFQTIDLSPKNPIYKNVNTSWATCLELCSLYSISDSGNATLSTCLAATFDLSTKICSLHNDFNSVAMVQPQTVAMTHISVYQTGTNSGSNRYRFTEFDHMAPKDDPTLNVTSYTVDTVEECLDACVDLGWNCTLASIGYGDYEHLVEDEENTLDCNLYQDIPIKFGMDPNSLNHSFIFNVQPLNSVMRKLPPFAKVKGTPLATFSATGLNTCLARALEIPNGYVSSRWWYFTYDSNLTLCTLYSQTVEGIEVNPNIQETVTRTSMTFANSVPTYNVDFYSYDYIWVDPKQVTFSQGEPSFVGGSPSSLDTCLATCINVTSSDSSNCPGLIYRPVDQQCAVLNNVQMQAILNRDQSSTASGTTIQSWQVFLKVRDLGFLKNSENRSIYGCMNTSVYDQQFSSVNRSNPLVGQQQIDQFEAGLRNNPGQWLEPHGPNFGGGPQPGLEHPGQGQGQSPLAPTPIPASPPSSSKITTKYLDTAPTLLQRDKATDIIIGGALTGAATGAAIGAVFGPVGAIVGGVFGDIIGGIGAFIGCLVACRDPPPRKLNCEEACAIDSAKTRFLDTLREISEISRARYLASLSELPKLRVESTRWYSEHPEEEHARFLNISETSGSLSLKLPSHPTCKCTSSPYPFNKRGALKSPDDTNRNLQEACDDKNLQETCEICCAAGYESAADPICVCQNAKAIWKPNPGKCQALDTCIAGERTWSTGVANGMMTRLQNVQRIPVKNCKDTLYYGVGFQRNRKIPLYSMYKFTISQTPYTGNRDSFSTYPCKDKDVNKKQLTNKWYIGKNKQLGNTGTLQRGHLTPDADMRFFRDSQKSTYYFINAAPQDSNSNNYWGKMEAQVRKLLSSPKAGDKTPGAYRGGWVITGTCYDEIENAGPIPKCFWKIVCTIEDHGVVTAAAFYTDNSFTTTDALKTARREQIYQVRNQDDLRTAPTDALGPVTIQDLWDEFKQFYPDNTKDMDACAKADKIKFPPLTFPPTDKQEDEFALYHWWDDNLFGKDFDRDTPAPPRLPTSSSGKPPACNKKVVGYVTSWSNVPFTKAAASYLTHAIMAFVEMKPDGTLVLGSPDPTHTTNPNLDRDQAYARMYELRNAKTESQGRLKTLFAVGGWENSQYFSSVIANDGLIQNFINSAIDIIEYFDMDGIDIDFEYPVTGGAHQGTPADRENYAKFLKAIRTRLNAHAESKGRENMYLLTIAGAAGAWTLAPGFNLTGIAEQVDWINVMTYDYFGAWESQWGAYTGPIAPLYYGAPANYSGKLNVDFTMKTYLCNITDSSKLIMGLGFYGRFWNNSGSPVNGTNPLWRKAIPNAGGKFDGGYLPFRNISFQYLNNGAITKVFDEPTRTPLMYQSGTGGMLLTYEDPTSIAIKVAYAAKKGFAGVMLWAVDLDDDAHTMLRTASSSTLCGIADKEPYKCPPNTGQRWWTLEDNPPTNGGMCGKSAPLFNGFYPVCDPLDPGYSCCSAGGYCGSGPKFCNCTGCVDYFTDPDKILDEPIKPNGTVRWLTMDRLVAGQPNCGYNSSVMMPDGSIPICNPDNDNAHCCSMGSYCGTGKEFCDCPECHDFKKEPNFVYPPKTWIDSGPDAGKCGKDAPQVNGHTATCNPLSAKFHCCSNSSFCGDGPEFCNCEGCVDFAKPSLQLNKLDTMHIYPQGKYLHDTSSV